MRLGQSILPNYMALAAVSYEAGSDSIAARARSLEDWIKLVRAMLPKRAPLKHLSWRFNVSYRILKRWKALANKNGVVVDDIRAVRAFVLQQKGMRLDTNRSKRCPLDHVDQLQLFRQVLQTGAPLQSLAAVLNVSRSRLVRARSKCIKEKVNWSSDHCLYKFLEANGVL